MAALFVVTDEIENYCMDKHKNIFKAKKYIFSCYEVNHFMKLRLKLLALNYMFMMCLWKWVVTMVGVLASVVVVEDMVEVLDTVTKAEEALEDMTTTMMEEILEVLFHLSEAKYLTGGWRGGV